MSRAVTIVRELCRHGRSSTLSLIECDVTGDSRALAEVAATLVHKLAAATGRDAGLLLDDIERDIARQSRR